VIALAAAPTIRAAAACAAIVENSRGGKAVSKPKLKKKSASAEARPSSKSLMESAQQIWMAGLGAFSRAQEEGTKLFEALVKEGLSLEQKTRRFATGKVDEARDAVETTVQTVRERAHDTWDRLEKVFEDRVARALSKLGVPGRDEMQALLDRVDELNRAMRKLDASGSAATKRSVKGSVAKARKGAALMVEAANEAQAAATKAVKDAVVKARKAATGA
jgi:poly(hydroxyalkanoate) granule-associated protein